jgi:hypothetical protein
MLRSLLVALSCLAAFDHFIGADGGAQFLAAMIQRLFN